MNRSEKELRVTQHPGERTNNIEAIWPLYMRLKDKDQMQMDHEYQLTEKGTIYE